MKYLVFVWGDVEPEVKGPYPTDRERGEEARRLRRDEGDEHGIFKLNIDAQGIPTMDTFSGGFFEEDEP